MANRRYISQFSYSFERMPVRLMGNITQTDLGAFATLVSNSITWTAVTMGAAGNSITIAVVAGGTAGAEVVTVSGNAISVQIESGVSTRTQVLTAVQASAAASALVSISVATGGTAASLLSATPLASGDDSDFTVVGLNSCTITQTGTGLFKIALADAYPNLIGASFVLQRATAVDLVPQLVSADPSSAKAIYFRLNAGATPTNMANSDVLYIELEFRNSANPV